MTASLPLLLWAGLAAAAADAGSWPPPELFDTGLYSDAKSLTVAPGNRPYAPQYPLWSDGAAKRRWVRLPKGRTIDASDPDLWVFPAGTRFWKEFSFGGRRVETRYLEKLGAGRWAYATYAWNEAQTAAARVPEGGARDAAEIAPSVRHDLPSLADCRACHEGTGRDVVLGFGALQLSPDRDPNAPHAEPKQAEMIDLSTLLAERLLVHAPPAWSAHPPAVPAASPQARAALGYLHGNCWGCHNARDPLASLGLWLNAPVGAAREADLPAVTSVLGKKSRFQLPEVAPGESLRADALVFRLASRHPSRQMPPLATKLVDDDAVHLIEVWLHPNAAPRR